MTAQETFAHALKLPARIAVYVPGTVNAARADTAAAQRMTDRAAAQLSRLFGGATITAADGAWVSDVHGLIREQINIVYSFALAEQIDAAAGEILALAEQIKNEMQQEAVSVEIGGALYLV